MVTPYQTPHPNNPPITTNDNTNNNPGRMINAPKLPMRPDATTAEDLKNADVIRVYTMKDVLNGRGQGVQRHPGNVKYRTLVFVNKTLYAKCPRNDKIKISRGIVAAVRQTGGRFLDLDERTNIYTDIGDKKATEKTSQALREGQTKIRKDTYENKDTTMPAMLPVPPVNAEGKWEISGEGYLEYSVKVLEELYKAEDNMTPEMQLRPAPHSVATQLGLQKRKKPDQAAPAIVSSEMPGLPPIVSAPDVSSAQRHMAAVYDQFEGMVTVQQQQQQQQQVTTHPNMPPPPNLPRTTVSSSGSPMRDTMSSQLTDISRLSLSQLLQLSANGERGTEDNKLLADLTELVRRSNSELMQAHLGGRDSSIRFTGLSQESLPNSNQEDGTARTTESSNTRLMERDTLLSFDGRPSTVHSGQHDSAMASSDRMSTMSGMDVDNDEANDVAEMLLRLSRDSDKKSGDAMEM
ncbi:hypothetical protein QTG54_008072 [Skeletonema marinoi]|uniref:DUF6824 domain-containing protein n=1 Tax=Skeletonema marinoi TaxID=267567 RepID=A0AAD8Y861_9STRA|nr:hypothetical protein QTG54_008072 [Skeletonema marinoi]|mmetsp:Transcript_28046/g.56335  ORF Transcript_28046/g.56335 Transcript_28046/m.56335 type:complete len:463 (+) Transcript_28046:59-1447(+)